MRSEEAADAVATSSTPSSSTSLSCLTSPTSTISPKNELILDLPKLIREAKYLGAYEDEGKKEWVVQTHLFEVEIEGEKSWLIALENKQGKIILHSISDSP